MLRPVAGSLLLSASAWCAPLITAVRVEHAPTVDGLLAEAQWAASMEGGMFALLGEDGSPQESTRFRVLWDEESLYLAVVCRESALVPAEQRAHLVKTDVRERDGSVFSDDVVELFLGMNEEGAYAHLAVNPAGTRYDARGKDKSWDLDWRAAARLGNGEWTMEAAVPLTALLGRAPRNGDEVPFNIAREEKPRGELSSWSLLASGFHEPQRFGTLVLADSAPALQVSNPRITADSWRADVRVASGGSAPSVEMTARGTTGVVGRLQLPVGGGKPAEGILVAAPGSNRQLTLHVSAGGTPVFRSRKLPVRGSEGATYAARFGTTAGPLTLYVNGEPVAQSGAGRPLVTSLRLSRGTSFLLLRCGGPGVVSGDMHSGHARLPLDGTWRFHQGWDDSWPDALEDAAGWAPAQDRVLPEAGGVFAKAIVLGGDSRTPLVPNCRVASFPKGTAQLFYPAIDLPALPLEGDYVFVVDLPPALRFQAADSRAGQSFAAPRVSSWTGQGGTYTRVRLSTPYVGRPGMEISCRFADSSNSTTAYVPTVALGGSHGWAVRSGTVRVPQGSVGLSPLYIKWQQRGVTGTCWLDDVEVREAESGRALFRRTFEEEAWQKKSHVVPREDAAGHAARIVALEENTKRQQALWLVDDPFPVAPGTLLEVSCKARCERLTSRGAQAKAALVAVSDAEPGVEVEGYLSYELASGFVVQHPRPFSVRVLPSLLGRRPRTLRIVPCYYSDMFEETASAAMAENIEKAGITGIYGHRTNEVVRRVKPDLHLIMSLPWHGYAAKMLGYRDEPLPKDLCQIDYKGRTLQHAMCPTYLLGERRPSFAHLGDWIAERLRNEGSYDEIDWDYETPVVDPPTFCFCPRCFESFARTIGVPAGGLTAERVVEAHRDEWTAFRCRQNAEVAGLLGQQIRRVAPGTLFSVYSGHQNKRTREHYGVDWEQFAPHVDLGIAGYGAPPAQARKTAAALATAGKPFMGGEMYFLSLGHSIRGTWHPEGWKVRLVRQTVESGGVGCLIWYLPTMDGAGFYETSRAAGLLTSVEEFVTANDRAEDTVRVLAGPEKDVVVLRRGEQRCLLLFNPQSKKRAFGIEARGTFREVLETGEWAGLLGEEPVVPAGDVRAFVEQD